MTMCADALESAIVINTGVRGPLHDAKADELLDDVGLCSTT